MATIMTESLVLTKISVIWLKLSLRRYTGMMFVTIQCLNSEVPFRILGPSKNEKKTLISSPCLFSNHRLKESQHRVFLKCNIS